MFVEPPKDFWFILGQYVPPPFGILALAAYLEKECPETEIEVVDCQAERLDWNGLEKRVESSRPDIVVASSLATCNAYTVLRTVDLAKKLNPESLTVVGGQHFTALAEESLREYPNIDVIIRGEGEETLAEIVRAKAQNKSLSQVLGCSYRSGDCARHVRDRSLIHDLNSLPFPGYHFVREHMKEYYFALMAGKDESFAIVEGSRGCRHDCLYCSQWNFWGKKSRSKSPKRIVDELEHINKQYGSTFFWLTDDNFGLGQRMNTLCEEILKRGLEKKITWFIQARCDDIVTNQELLVKMRKAGNIWILLGLDTPDAETLAKFRRQGVSKDTAKQAVDLLRKNSIFSQGTFIIGDRRDSHESISTLCDYADQLDPDIATFMALTPFPGTEVYENAKRNNWIEDTNWNNYDMIHAIMPTEHLTRIQVQQELYECYQAFFGSWKRRYQGIFSDNIITRRTYQYLARQAILTALRSLF
jgi:anaerobic magnesium-protoporphyrin IX monomethyl ester cyclase